MTKEFKRFIALKEHKGIRKDQITGNYVARKYVDNKEFCETFDKLSEAIYWRRNFHPLLTNSELKVGASTKSFNDETKIKISSRPNGVDQRFKFEDVWELYKKQYFPTLESQTIDDRLKFAKNFYADLMHLKMLEVTPELMDHFMARKVSEAKILNNPRRINFDNDLKALKAMFNWYRENYDGMFINPILKRHFAMGIIKQRVKASSRKMTIEQVRDFLNAFKDQFWRDFAELHFYMAGRVQELGGLQIENVDLKKGLVRVVDVAIWGDSKRFSRLKETPKNGEERTVHLNKRMEEILRRRIAARSSTPCLFFRESTGERLDFVFQINGQPVTYRQVQYSYNFALEKAGLFPKFQSTHILRKAMANIVRKEMGLDAAQAAGGWKSRDVVERTYTDAPNELNRQTVMHIEKLLGDSDQEDRDTKSRKEKLRLVVN
ncbi:MAG: tyrosine-type recombinase/integrase [Bdellovibrio sp.]|nr:tyrosine-type recombinase/integrase [Bdellovibrio sp.]